VKTILFVVTFCLAGAMPVAAQVPVNGAVDPPAGYDTGGRRDPFVSLVAPRRPTSTAQVPVGPRKTGLAALALADAKVSGIVRNGDETMAILEGPEGKSFVVRAKARLLDAEVKTIDAAGVVFIERLDGAPDAQAREVRKPLRSIAEVIK
jgi:hypothetical protein